MPGKYEAYEKEVEGFLEKAIQEDLFEVWYQPVYGLKEGRFVTMEALSRLKHPVFGWIPPDLFIMIAVQNGMIQRIMPLQLHRICKFIKKNPYFLTRLESIKVNLSPGELAETGYCEELLAIIKSYGLPCSWFQFEITETTVTRYTQTLRESVRSFQKEGVKLCLDDFGSGYADLNAAINLPFSVIKLDRSLLQGICEKPADALFYKNIASILKDMGYKVLAEGAEKKEEVELLRKWNVDMIQGYYFSHPLPPEKLVKLYQV